MRYVKIKPRPDCGKSPCGRLTYVECGLPCENGHRPMFVLHEGEENCIPAWAAAELDARGHEILEVNEIVDGAHAVLPGKGVAHIDVATELAEMPDHEVDRFLRHHGFHEHIRHHDSGPTPARRGAMTAGPAPTHLPEQMRAKAHELHRSLGHIRIEAARVAASSGLPMLKPQPVLIISGELSTKGGEKS